MVNRLTEQPAPLLVVGLGLAGTLLTWELSRQGIPFVAIDNQDPATASRVAPGIVNPLAGKRLRPSWQVGEQLPAAKATYAALGETLGATLFHPKTILRVLVTEDQRAYFERRQRDATASNYIGQEHRPGLAPGMLNDPYGSFAAAGSGHLDLGKLLELWRARLEEQGHFREGTVDPKAVTLTPEGVIWEGEAFSRVVFCDGGEARRNPYFEHLPFRPAKGEMLYVTTSSPLPEDTILNAGKWVLPLGEGRYWAGATYAWDNLDPVPTPAAREEILHALGQFLKIPFEVIGQHAGVRPIIRDYRPVLGTHPEHPQVAIFNGLGSKGVLSGPWLAQHLMRHLQEGTAIPREMDVKRFFDRR